LQLEPAVIRDARVSVTLEQLFRSVAEDSLALARQAVAERGRFSISLAGGSTPAALYALWARDYGDRMPWDRTFVFFGDERYVPADDPASNYHMARETLLDHVAIPPEQIFPMRTDYAKPEDAASGYQQTLRRFFGPQAPVLDLLLLGLGTEGHTASLFPDSPVLQEKERWVAAPVVPAKPSQRLTLTLPLLNQVRAAFFLVAGAAKREIVQAIRNEPDSGSEATASRYPAARIRPASGRVVWYLDQAASGS
jgi:6-phosphogluconolactonase